MASKTLTAPLALIKVDGVTVGKCRDLRITETFQLGRVGGVGRITPAELPVLSWSGRVTTDHYEVDFATSGIPDAIKRIAPSVQDFVDNILLDCRGVDIVLLKKVCDFTDPETGLIKSKLREHLTIWGAIAEQEGMNLSENQISGHNQNFQYQKPVLLSLEDAAIIEAG